MKKTILIFLLSFFFGKKSFSQVAINAKEAKGALDIYSLMENGKYGGLVLPAVLNINEVSTPDGQNAVEGTLIYDQKNHCMRYKKKGNWSNCLGNTIKNNDLGEKNHICENKCTDQETRLRELERNLVQNKDILAAKSLEVQNLKKELTQKQKDLQSKDLELQTSKEQLTKNDLEIHDLQGKVTQESSKNKQLQASLDQSQEEKLQLEGKSKQLEDKFTQTKNSLENKVLEIQNLKKQLTQKQKDLQSKDLEIQACKDQYTQSSMKNSALQKKLNQCNDEKSSFGKQSNDLYSFPAELRDIKDRFFEPKGADNDVPYIYVMVYLMSLRDLLAKLFPPENNPLMNSVNAIVNDFLGLDEQIKKMILFIRNHGIIYKNAQYELLEAKEVFDREFKTFLALEGEIKSLANQEISKKYEKIKGMFKDLKNISSEFYEKIKAFFESKQNR